MYTQERTSQEETERIESCSGVRVCVCVRGGGDLLGTYNLLGTRQIDLIF